MTDATNTKSSPWTRIVAELVAPAPDDRTFLARMTTVLGRVASARAAVLLRVPSAGESGEAADPQPQFAWPTDPSEVGPSPQAEHASAAHAGSDREWSDRVPALPEIKKAARATAQQAQSLAHAPAISQPRLFGLEGSDDGLYAGPARGSIVAVALALGPGETPEDSPSPSGTPVVCMLIEHRSPQALATTLALVELIAGYSHSHALRQAGRRARLASASLDLAARLIAAINSTSSFKGSCLRLANDLARQFQADRVTLGWVKGAGRITRAGERAAGDVHAVAMSDTEHLDRRTSLVQKLEAAMDECLDQEQAVVHPQPPESGEGGDALLARAITHCHRELAAADARLKVASVPLRTDAGVVGVVTVESSSPGRIEPATVELLQACMDLIAPVLVLRRSDDRPLPQRAADESLRLGSWLVGPRHTAWKLAALGLILFTLFGTLVPLTYRVEAPMELRAIDERIVSMPFTGVLAVLPPHIKPGTVVAEGELLAGVDTTELLDRLADDRSALDLATRQADAARTSGEFDTEAEARARIDQASARIAQMDYYLQRAQIKAPIAGTIMAGDLTSRVGQSLQQGEPLFQIAKLDTVQVVARVRDEDIKLIAQRMRQAEEKGERATGQMATKAEPDRPFAIVVDRVVPLAQPIDGQNVFEVYATLDPTQAQSARFKRAVFRPGMEGLVKLDADRRPLLDILTRRLRDQLRLWLWW